MITLEKIKQHIRVDGADEDSILGIYMAAAVDYVTTITGIINNIEAPARYDMAVLLLVAHWFTNREASGAGAKLPYGFDMLVFALKKGASHV